MAIGPRPLVVLEDDPTGTQTLASAQVVCVPSAAAIEQAAAAPGVRSLHVLTNSRALDPEGARRVTRDAAAAAASALPGARVVLRGDSTLRAHVVEEYLAYVEVIAGGAHLPLVLVPALPGAGRTTRNGQHLIAGVPLDETEYARDPDLGYSTARLLDWAQERSSGLFAASRGNVVTLEQLRAGGPGAVAEAIERARSRVPAAVAVDAETDEDLEVVAQGIAAAPPSCVRCAPALVGALAGNTARTFATAAPLRPGTLVVCGSWVPLAARQLAALEHAHPGTSVRADPTRLLSGAGAGELERAARECHSRITDLGIAVLSTPRERDLSLGTPALRELLAKRLALIVRVVAGAVGAVVAKGGITSAVTASVGLGATRAEVAGPVAPGVALWLPCDGPTPACPTRWCPATSAVTT